MIKYIFRKVHKTEVELTENKAYKPGCWIIAEKPTEKEISQLVEQFNLDIDLLNDALDEHEVPRIEVENGHVYIFSRYVSVENNRTNTYPILLVYADNFVLTFSVKGQDFLKKLMDNTEITTTQKTKLALTIFAGISDTYKNSVYKLRRKIMVLSTNIEGISNKDIVAFVEYEKILNEFLASLVPYNQIFSRIILGSYLKLYDEDKDLVEDLALNNDQLIEISKSTLKTIVNIREAYTTIMSNNLNRTMKGLTLITILMTIPNVITSFFGMNVYLPFSNSPATYIWIIGISIGVIGTLSFFFIRKDLF